MKLIEKDFLTFYKIAHFNYGVVITPFTIGLGMIPGHYMSSFFVIITLGMIGLSHYYKNLLNAQMFIRVELIISFIVFTASFLFLYFDNLMIYAILFKTFDIFKEYLIRAESAIFNDSMHVIVKKDYSKLYILLGLSFSTLIFWIFGQHDAILLSICLVVLGDSILLLYKIKMIKNLNRSKE
jgi:hypothetical protein